MIKGFTLIETLVAIAILTILMVAPFYSIEQSIIAADAARDELTGTFIAQEGIEYVRSVRDSDYLFNRLNPANTASWLYGVDGTSWNGAPSPNCLAPSYDCTIDITTNTAVSYSVNTAAPVLLLDANTHRYNQSTGAATAFTRTIQLTELSANEVKVVSKVTWRTRTIPYVTTVTEYLDNWLAQ